MKGLLFIPDISGFTRFVTDTEIEHSRRIIQELLEAMVDANQLGLEVSEIEGDAILFYRFGEAPEMRELYAQVARTFCDFHGKLAAYETCRFCHCKACVTAARLTLKIITHYGEFTSYTVKNFNKLIGKDVIVAHQLLKNDVAENEYWLVTSDLLRDDPPGALAEWMRWTRSAKKTDEGEIPFHYARLSELRSQIPERHPVVGLSEKVWMLSASREYDCHIITLFHATGDFSYRGRWRDGVKRVEDLDHHLPRLGMTCRCIHEKGEEVLYASDISFHPEKIEFTETDARRTSASHYTLERITDDRTRLTWDFYLARSRPRQLLFTLLQKGKTEESIRKSMLNLDTLVKELHVPTEY